MNRVARVALGVGLLLAAVVAMGALTRAPFQASPDRAELRLAWRFRVPPAEHCRRPTPDELAELPVHMRQEEICESRPVRYRLEASVDGRVEHRSMVEAAGARGDRPLYVLEAVPLEPGEHSVRIVFERADAAVETSPAIPPDESPGAEPSPQPVGDPRLQGSGEPEGSGRAVPERLVLERRVRTGTHDVMLVTYDPDARVLELRGQEDR